VSRRGAHNDGRPLQDDHHQRRTRRPHAPRPRQAPPHRPPTRRTPVQRSAAADVAARLRHQGADALRSRGCGKRAPPTAISKRRDLAAANSAVAQLPQLPKRSCCSPRRATSAAAKPTATTTNAAPRARSGAGPRSPTTYGALVALGHLLREGSNLWREARELAERALQHDPAGTTRTARRCCALADPARGRSRRARRSANCRPRPTGRTRSSTCCAKPPAKSTTTRRSPAGWQQVLRIVSHAPDDVLAAANLLLRLGQTADAACDLLVCELVRAPLARNCACASPSTCSPPATRAALQLLESLARYRPRRRRGDGVRQPLLAATAGQRSTTPRASSSRCCAARSRSNPTGATKSATPSS
jgi:hypothetical protein